jgi:hypothetical protein
MATNGVELYLYWRVPQAALATALAGTARFQRAVEQSHPALQARLLHRVDEQALRDDAQAAAPPPVATVMETYRMPGAGIGAPLEALLRGDGDAATAAWRQGPRHCERFLPA